MTARAVLCGTYVNAVSIVGSLRRLGWTGEIMAVKPRAQGPVLIETAAPEVRVVELDFQAPADLLPWLAGRGGEQVVFLTDERFHYVLAPHHGVGARSAVRVFVGSPAHLDTILDRQLFCHFLASRRLAETPRTIPSSEDPWRAFGDRFLLRVRRSWQGLAKLPRARVVGSRAELAALERRLEEQGLDRQAWCYQELLSVAPRHNVSVGGWHGPGVREYLTTRKVLQHPPRTGNGDVCEVLPAMPELDRVTSRLLDELAFEGPFELEFVLDASSGRYHVIELNPRFWMQHALVEAATGDGPVRRCLGLPPADAPPAATVTPRYWVNGIYALYRLMRGDVRIGRFLLSRRSLCVPDLGTALRFLARSFGDRFGRRRLRCLLSAGAPWRGLQ